MGTEGILVRLLREDLVCKQPARRGKPGGMLLLLISAPDRKCKAFPCLDALVLCLALLPVGFVAATAVVYGHK